MSPLDMAPPAEESKAKAKHKTKRCNVCKVERHVRSFAKHPRSKDGKRRACRKCARAGKAFKEATAEQLAKAIQRQKEEKHRAQNRLSVKRWKEDHPLAVIAHRRVSRAVRSGLIVPAAQCQAHGCERTSRLQSHHHDYRDWRDVAWLCPSHHRRLHTAGFLVMATDDLQRYADIPREVRH